MYEKEHIKTHTPSFAFSAWSSAWRWMAASAATSVDVGMCCSNSFRMWTLRLKNKKLMYDEPVAVRSEKE